MMNMMKEMKVTCKSFELLTLQSLNLIIYYASVSVTWYMISHRMGYAIMPYMDKVFHEPFLARQIKIIYYIQNFS